MVKPYTGSQLAIEVPVLTNSESCTTDYQTRACVDHNSNTLYDFMPRLGFPSPPLASSVIFCAKVRRLGTDVNHELESAPEMVANTIVGSYKRVNSPTLVRLEEPDKLTSINLLYYQAVGSAGTLPGGRTFQVDFQAVVAQTIRYVTCT